MKIMRKTIFKILKRPGLRFHAAEAGVAGVEVPDPFGKPVGNPSETHLTTCHQVFRVDSSSGHLHGPLGNDVQ